MQWKENMIRTMQCLKTAVATTSNWKCDIFYHFEAIVWDLLFFGSCALFFPNHRVFTIEMRYIKIVISGAKEYGAFVSESSFYLCSSSLALLVAATVVTVAACSSTSLSHLPSVFVCVFWFSLFPLTAYFVCLCVFFSLLLFVSFIKYFRFVPSMFLVCFWPNSSAHTARNNKILCCFCLFFHASACRSGSFRSFFPMVLCWLLFSLCAFQHIQF